MRAVRVTFLCHAGTTAMRAGRFPLTDDPLDAASEARLERLRFTPGRRPCWTSPARCARETAARLGLDAAPTALLADMDWGAWAGVPLVTAAESDPDAFSAWLEELDPQPVGGEPFVAVSGRVGQWLEGLDREVGAVAVTHPTVIRAALTHALNLPPQAARAIDVVPLRLTHLSGGPGRWRLAGLNIGLPVRRTSGGG